MNAMAKARDYPSSAVPWPEAVGWARRELRGYLDAVGDPALQELPTRCPPWTVHDLSAHLAASFQRFADQLDKARAGDLEPPFAPPEHLSAENLRAVRDFRGEPLRELEHQARRFLDAVEAPEERMGHQFGAIPVGLQVLFGLNELVVHHDDLAHAAGGRYRPDEEVVAVLSGMYGAVLRPLPAGGDLWSRLLQATGR